MSPPGAGFTVTTSTGENFCLDDCTIYNCNPIIQRDRTVYGESADDFVPERWLSEECKGFPPGAWRPFECGPRQCIGQDLALMEARIVLALVARRYDFVKVGLGSVVLADGDNEDSGPVPDEKGRIKTKDDLFNVSTNPRDLILSVAGRSWFLLVLILTRLVS